MRIDNDRRSAAVPTGYESLEVSMKRAIITLLAIALLSCLLGGCLTLKPFTQDELDRLTAVAVSGQAC